VGESKKTTIDNCLGEKIMKLSELKAKAKAGLTALFGGDKKFKVDTDSAVKGSNRTGTVVKQRDAIELKRQGGNVLIKCWNCGKETWVRIGSNCHRNGVCSKCIDNI
jgi:hypothetical protein